jgi:branched-chain amino acid transport system substrate-binding protein
VSKRSTLVILIYVLTIACSTSAAAEILIATAAPISGRYAWMGEQYKRGAEMAVADLNAAGGVLGQNVRLVIGDDGCDADQAVVVANKFASDGVIFVAGHFCSGASIPASKVYEETGILMISPSSTNPKLTDEGGTNVFRVCGRDDQQGVVAGDYLADTYRAKKTAIIHDGTAYGEGLAEETRKQLNSRGVTEAMYAAYEPGEADYSPLVSKMRTAGIDVVYIGGYSTEAALIVRQAHDLGYEIQLVSGDAIVTEDFWLIAGAAGEGTLMTFFPDPRNNPEAVTVVKRFRAQNFEPEGYTLYAYAAVQTWAQAAAKAHSLELDVMIESLRRNAFETVLGELRFDDKGDVTTPSFTWYVWNNGQYVPLD